MMNDTPKKAGKSGIEEKGGDLSESLPGAVSSKEPAGAPPHKRDDLNDYDADAWRPDDSAREAGTHVDRKK